MGSGKDGAEKGRRQIIAEALADAEAHLTVPNGSARKPVAQIALAHGERIEVRHIEIDGDRVLLLSAARGGGKDGQFDATVTHIDQIASVAISDDGSRRHVEPMSYDPAMKALVKRIIDNDLYPTLSDEMELRQLVSTEEGLARIEEAAIALGDDHLIDSVADAIGAGRRKISELDEAHRRAICKTFAKRTVQKAVEATYRPYIREGDWQEQAIEHMTSPGQ